MMEPVHRIDAENASATSGQVRLDLVKLFWNGGMIGVGIGLAPYHTNVVAIFLGLSLTYVTLLLGHSVGMHRLMIHRSFNAKPWLRNVLLYLGTLGGIGGPSAVIEIHDIRDWAQREKDCHDFFSHRREYWRDLTWQLFYRFDLTNPLKLSIEPEVSENLFAKHLDQFWRWHQIGLGIILFMMGGLPFVIWGICLRVAISIIGHWSITYICHNPGPGKWDVIPSGVQASNLAIPGWIGRQLGGWITHGECWHNNHHAFPESARIGLYHQQIDPAAWVIETLERTGLVWNVGEPRQAIDDLRLRTPLSKSIKL